MVFAFNLLFSSLCAFCFSRFYTVEENNRFVLYLLVMMPVWALWIIICGGQYAVGTDYFSYTNLFEGKGLFTYYYKKEYIFVVVAEFLSRNNLSPQLGFYFFYTITTLCFVYIISRLEHRTSFIFLILYIAVSTAFNNQLNGLRQYVALSIALVGLVQMTRPYGVIRYLVCVTVATLVHSSSLLFLPLIYFRYKPNISVIRVVLYLLFAVAFSLLGSFDFIWDILGNYIPTQYTHYMGSDYDTSHGIVKAATKLMYVPFYLWSSKLIADGKLEGFYMYLYKLGIVGYAIRLTVMDNRVFNRFGISFILISLFPLYMLLKDWYERGQYVKFTLTILFFIAFYFVKVVALPQAEYLYSSIYFMTL